MGIRTGSPPEVFCGLPKNICASVGTGRQSSQRPRLRVAFRGAFSRHRRSAYQLIAGTRGSTVRVRKTCGATVPKASPGHFECARAMLSRVPTQESKKACTTTVYQRAVFSLPASYRKRAAECSKFRPYQTMCFGTALAGLAAGSIVVDTSTMPDDYFPQQFLYFLPAVLSRR